MADWKQITARIRRARTSKDPAAQLSTLFAKTRDAMVAFELARYFETTGNNDNAGRWYFTAAERFRRADWKTKAQEAATRLGATEPALIPILEHAPASANAESSEESVQSPDQVQESSPEPVAQQSETDSAPANAETHPSRHHAKDSADRPAARGRSRRRRGGKDRNSRTESRQKPESPRPPAEPLSEEAAIDRVGSHRMSSQSESSGDIGSVSVRGRFGDPGLSSRISQLEMNFRRLLACPAVSPDKAERAPAGPGVWLLTDSDQTTYYYVEPCQTLRIAIGNLLRSGSTKRGEPIKPRLAEHLGIAESRVNKYLTDHCVVRWLQLDDGAPYFAHFLIAVLRPTLNE